MPTPRKSPASQSSDGAAEPRPLAKSAPKKPALKKVSVNKAPVKRKPKSTGLEPAAAKRKRTAAGAADPDAPRPTITPDGSGNYDLLIVESPAKAKTINKYLGNRFRVLASYGHVRDLATGRKQPGEEISGIRISDGWKLRYLVDAGAKAAKNKGKNRRSQQDILNELGQVASKANRVILASDPDREGESIAWHIADELNLDLDRTLRVRFNEITKNAVQQALAGATAIDMDRVRAQEARRAMDRVVGFPLSSLLGEKVTRGLSAGRVQSVAVKIIVDREREIEAFKSEEYWRVHALLTPTGSGVVYKADPAKAKVFAKKASDKPAAKAGEKPSESDASDADEVAEVEATEAPEAEGGEAKAAPAAKSSGLPTPPPGSFLAELAKFNGADPVMKTEAECDAIAAAVVNERYVVSKLEQKDKSDRPPPPFTTSTLQQQSNIRLRFSASRTMQTAQKLYEGIDLGPEGTVALITYMRTDSARISPEALNNVRAHIDATFGPDYLPQKPNFYASGKGAQEGHECVRPTDVSMTPRRAERAGLGGDQLRLYSLIYNRFVACQMTPAVYAVTTVEVTAGPALFRATGRILKFDGYRKVMAMAGGKGAEDTELPQLAEGQRLDKLDLTQTQHFTQPPARFNEASLVKMLEKEGIGRPSTYASIIETIQNRGYVRQDARRFFATDTGKVVTDLLVQHFPRIMDLKFTSHFEEELDDIERGKSSYAQVLDEFWTPFSADLKRAAVEMPGLRGIEVGEACPRCGKPLLQLFSAKTGKPFVGCSGYRDDPKCSYIKPEEGQPERPEPTVTDIKCPADGGFMVQKTGRFGTFFTCQNAPGCPTLMNLGADGKPVVTALPTTHRCPKCHKQNLLLKLSKAGKNYLSCPDAKCKYIVDADAEGNVVKPPSTGIACEKCGSDMVIRSSWRGPFLACSAYPKCKNSKSINAELREQLKDILPPPAAAKPKDGDTSTAVAKSDTPNVAVTDECPECGSPMRLQKSRFGGRYFLGCTKYPKCKGTKKPSPELQQQLDAAAT